MHTEPLIAGPRKIAIVHDWLVSHRGGEKCLEAIAELYPQATIHTLFYTKGKVGPILESYRIETSSLNRLPWVKHYYRYLLPLLPAVIESFDLSEFDLVISSSHCVAKGVVPSPGALHICYSYTPMRYAWDRARDYFRNPISFNLAHPFLHYLRQWDASSSNRVDHFIADSQWAADRIEKFYRRNAIVIYPFADTSGFHTLGQPRRDYYLIVSGFAPYKRIDLAIQACKKLGRRLKIVGEGQDGRRLKKLGDSNIEFLGRVTFQKLRDAYSGARALLFPGEEDFGIAPLEAMASGRPVIAFARGGAMETVVENETGLFFKEQTVDSLVDAILKFESQASSFSPEKCRNRSLYFNKERFQTQFQMCVSRWWAEHQNRRHASLKIPGWAERPAPELTP